MTNDERRNAPDDETLMARIAAGDMDMLGVLYTRYVNMVQKALRRFAPEMPTAVVDELTQEVFLLISRKAGRYQNRQKAKAYIYGVAVKKAGAWRRNTLLRRKLMGKAAEERFMFGPSEIPSPAEGIELREVVTQALARLSERQRTVLLLHSVEGFTGEEIADILGISAKTVRTRLFRARQTLLGNINKKTRLSVLRKEAS